MVWIVILTAPAAVAGGNAERGRELFAKDCHVCHEVVPGFNKEGPSLYGVYGRRAGTAPFFSHYKALKGSDIVWTDETLDRWLADPRAFAGGRDTAMIIKLDSPRERADIIAYLKTLR